MRRIPVAPPPARHRWWVLATVIAGQFMFGVDVFVVNVALPTIAIELPASAAQIEAVVAVYLLGYGTLVVVGGRLGDLYGTKRVFLVGVAGFTLASLGCGLAQSGAELIAARLAQGVAAALMVPQVLATLHLQFPDAARARAFAIYGVVLGLAGAAGFLLGGVLVTLDLAGLGWRTVFLVNLPAGLAVVAAAWRLLPTAPRRIDVALDFGGAALLFAALLCLLGPLLAGHDAGWTPWLLAVMATGLALVGAFVRFERRLATHGGTPLVDLALFADRVFGRGLAAVFAFFFANLSFYFVVTLFLQDVLRATPLQAGLAVLPLALCFVVASHRSGGGAAARRPFALVEGCLLQLASLAAVAATVRLAETPSLWLLTSVMALFGYGQGRVMAPLSGVVLAPVAGNHAGAAAGLYGMTTHIANAAGIAVLGSLYVVVAAEVDGRTALFVALALAAAAIAASALILRTLARPHRDSR